MIRIRLKEPRQKLEEVNIDKDPKKRGVSWWNKVALKLARATSLDPREAAETIDWLAGLILNESADRLLTENVTEVARKLQVKFPDKFKWDALAGKIGEFSTSPIEAGQLLTWVAKQLLDDNAEVEYHGEMTKEMQLLEAARLFTQNKQFLKNKDINSYKNQPEVLASVKEGMNSPAALRAREKRV